MKLKSCHFRLAILAPDSTHLWRWVVSRANAQIGQGDETTHPAAKREGALFRRQQIALARASGELAPRITRRKSKKS